MLFACGYCWEQQERCVKQIITQLSENVQYSLRAGNKKDMVYTGENPTTDLFRGWEFLGR